MDLINIDQLTFDERGLIPAIVQDVETREVLMLAYMNEESLGLTLKTGKTCFFSRSRQELWHKGATSGNTQRVERIAYDCDGDTLLILVRPVGPACHTGEQSCFYRVLAETTPAVEESGNQSSADSLEGMIQILYSLIEERKRNPIEDSYTCYLFTKGLDKILKKVGEETAEVLIGAKNQSREELVYEISDLVYHLLVLMVETEVTPEEIQEELAGRYKK